MMLVVGTGFGFWLVLQSVDLQAEYLMAARTIKRWDVASAQDFSLVVGSLSRPSR